MSSGLKRFKGTDSQYKALHDWVRKQLGKPQECWHCGDTSDRVYHWANKSQNYLKDINDWERLCPPCHAIKDGVVKAYCHNGHKMVEENLRYKPNGQRLCVECQRQYLREWRRTHKQDPVARAKMKAMISIHNARYRAKQKVTT